MASSPWTSPSFISDSKAVSGSQQFSNVIAISKIVSREQCPILNSAAAYKFQILKAQASGKGDKRTKPKSVICVDCDGNGAVQCSQCKGSGVNSEDLFNGQFKAGDSCWLCGGRKEMLCGNCNGAGFVGGFLSTYDQ